MAVPMYNLASAIGICNSTPCTVVRVIRDICIPIGYCTTVSIYNSTTTNGCGVYSCSTTITDVLMGDIHIRCSSNKIVFVVPIYIHVFFPLGLSYTIIFTCMFL